MITSFRENIFSPLALGREMRQMRGYGMYCQSLEWRETICGQKPNERCLEWVKGIDLRCWPENTWASRGSGTPQGTNVTMACNSWLNSNGYNETTNGNCLFFTGVFTLLSAREFLSVKFTQSKVHQRWSSISANNTEMNATSVQCQLKFHLSHSECYVVCICYACLHAHSMSTRD